jgi:hypothetical protein
MRMNHRAYFSALREIARLPERVRAAEKLDSDLSTSAVEHIVVVGEGQVMVFDMLTRAARLHFVGSAEAKAKTIASSLSGSRGRASARAHARWDTSARLKRITFRGHVRAILHTTRINAVTIETSAPACERKENQRGSCPLHNYYMP